MAYRTTRAPTVSVVLAVYNGERFIGEAVESILDQTLDRFEFIIVDDGSTDRSREIVAGFGDPRIRVLTNPDNLGLTPSLNRGLVHARGEFVARIDADDVAEPSRLEVQVEHMRRRPELALLGSWWRVVDERGRLQRTHRSSTDHWDLLWDLTFFNPFCHSAMLWRRLRVAERVGMYDPKYTYAMDYDLAARVAYSLRVGAVPQSLVRYRVGPDTMTSTHPARSSETREIRLGAAAAWLKGDPAESRRWRSFAPTLGAIVDEGWAECVAPPEVDSVVARVQALHRTFVSQLGLRPAEARRSRRHLRRWLARSLFRGARGAHRRGASELRDALTSAALRTSPAAFLMPAALRYAWSRIRPP